jgi:branched-subunit amino acid ABC-type transport system permease component
MTFEDIVNATLTGLTSAGLLFVVSVGLTLVFGALRVINLAHGSLYMVGAFVTSSIVAWLGGGVGLWPALLLAAVAAAAVGVIAEVGVLRRLYGKEHLLQLLATYALVLILADLVQIVWGASNRTVDRPAGLDGSVTILGQGFAVYNLWIIGFALAVGAGLYLLLNRSALGRNIRAAIDDPEMLAGVGVNVPLLFTTVFVLGAALAGAAGAVVAPLGAVGLGMDIDIIVLAFAVTIIGGLGSIPGALAGATIVGLVDSFGIEIAPRFTLAFVFVVMVVVLAVRPTGLFGVPERA